MLTETHLEPGTKVLFKTAHMKEVLAGTIESHREQKSKWGKFLYRVDVGNGKVRWAYPDELTVAE